MPNLRSDTGGKPFCVHKVPYRFHAYRRTSWLPSFNNTSARIRTVAWYTEFHEVEANASWLLRNLMQPSSLHTFVVVALEYKQNSVRLTWQSEQSGRASHRFS